MLSICAADESIFDQKTTEIQSDKIIQDLSQIKEVPDVNIPLPDIYLAEPKIIQTRDGVRLFYFTKHHAPDKLSVLIKEQLSDLKVSQNPATNQLIIQCKTNEEAQAVIDFLKEVDVPPIQVTIHCLISELYADRTMDRETTLLIKDLFDAGITLGGKEIGLLPEEFWPHPDIPGT
jgi:hypothetical protein